MKRTVIVSDYSGKEITDENDLYTVTLTPKDKRKAVMVADAHATDKIVVETVKNGRPANKRKPKLVKLETGAA